MKKEDVLAELVGAKCSTEGCIRLPCMKVETKSGIKFLCRICLDYALNDSATDLRITAKHETKQKGESMIKITGEELAPRVLVDIMMHYIDRLTLEIKEILFIDDYEDERINAYEPDHKIICMNLGKLPVKIAEQGWGNTMICTALWMVQVSTALEVIRIAVQEQYYGFEKMDEEELDRDIELFIGQELRVIAARDERLFIPEFLEEMGVIGLRLRDALNEQHKQGGAKKDLAAWTVGGDVDTDEFRRFMKSEVVDKMQKAIREGEMGRYVEGFYFLTIGEYLALVCEEDCLTEGAAAMAEYSEAIIDEGSLAPADKRLDLGFIEPVEESVLGITPENSENTKE